ncbi:Alpha-ketoglutaric semialdehyde dehydrogenase [Pirellulimonas nuda]|uniref:Alpha-ketoglutaric semialdehyde dehydrogenase n=1 Tax=Pirellulimonas nuda TaxID=2528009 RepID=A0A518DBD7_9BACT|nr:aldehyde dehydrogenase family protein [Pirellulimonas nuda]QDU88773.1 Alpha-ketoglutaric semialdehyde dehydrogenase [Pirellulimonas nuda]
MTPVLIAGEWVSANAKRGFRAHDPKTSEPIGDEFPVSDWSDCDAALSAAVGAAEALEACSGDQIASFLDAYAGGLAGNAEAICRQAEEETALPYQPRLADVEMPRTVNQLRLAAEAARVGAWRAPVVDAAANIRSCYGPLGPVFVLGPNNFPLAFNAVSGGDFAAAIATGNPVIAKAHPAHPATTRLLAQAAQAAAAEAGLPAASVQLLYGVENEHGLRMAADPRLAAVAFTGSRPAGLALKAAADAVGKPIYLEMSSVNPVFFLPGAVAERRDALIEELAGSCLMAAGQFCTCPNLFVLHAGDDAEAVLQGVQDRFQQRPAGALFAEAVVRGLASSIASLKAAGAEVACGGAEAGDAGFRFQNTLLKTTGDAFLANPAALQTEAFGPVSLAVVVRDGEQAVQVARHIEGSLTGSIYSSTQGDDDALALRLQQTLRRRVGRLINDKMPTGVAVSPAMNHGGPFPATGNPGFTAVGIPASLRRFAKLDCYDNVRPARLPACLAD